MEKFKKIDKRFQLSDESVNVHGFRLLTSGYLIDEYKKNPIGYLMHKRDDGVLLKWEDLTIEGDKVYGKPVINMSHPRAQQTVDEIENGFLNAASLGHFVVLDYSTDPELMLPDQTGPTVTKWFNRECSLVDIPGNMNALSLFDKDENPINLSDLKNQNVSTMEKIVFTPQQLAAMNLKDDAKPLEVNNAFNDLVAKANKADDLQKQLDDLKAKSTKEKVDALLKTALEDDKKITKEFSDQLAEDYKDNPEGLKNLLDKMPAYKSVTDQLGEGKKDTKDLADKSWDELHASGKLEDLKANNPELWKQKFKEQFGTEPKD